MPNFQEIMEQKEKEHKKKMTSSTLKSNPVRDKTKKEKIQDIYDSMLKRIDIPKRFKDKSFKNYDASRLKFDDENPVNKIKEYVETFEERFKNGDWLILSGGYGLGKTHLAIATAKEVLKYFAKKYHERRPRSLYYSGHAEKIVFVPSSELIQNIRDSYDNDGINERDIINRYKSAPLLIIDDLGTEKASDWQKEKMYNILNHRYLEMLPTIITTNLSSNGLKDQVSERVVERMIEAAGNGRYLWKFKGKSYRRSKTKNE